MINRYAQRIVSAEFAVSAIRSGQRVVFGHACGKPLDLVSALVARADELRDVEIVHMAATGPVDYCHPTMANRFYHTSLCVSGGTRDAVRDGRADYIPASFSEVPGLLRGPLRPDVALVQVTPPDAHGFCSFGVSVDYTKPAAEAAAVLIAQVNPTMPRTHGDAFIHQSRVSWFVETDTPIVEVPPVAVTEDRAEVCRNVAALVNDGATLQLGIGSIPEALPTFLRDKTDLGLHSEMLSDGLMDLIDRGILTNSRKSVMRERSVASFVRGSRALYDFVDDNPAINLFPVDFVNDSRVIGTNNGVVAVNGALAVDLLGQVAADTLGPLQYSGIGGQLDFCRGARQSKDGMSVIALPSTANGGTLSRIVAALPPGAAITTGRADVDVVVTEFGAAHLRGMSARRRVEALLAIAAPEHRDAIADDYARLRATC